MEKDIPRDSKKPEATINTLSWQSRQMVTETASSEIFTLCGSVLSLLIAVSNSRYMGLLNLTNHCYC